MLTEPEKKELLSQLQEKRTEIRNLKSSLNQINSQKESWFSKKEALSKQIAKLIGQVRESKTSRDSFTTQVKDTKKKRDTSNTAIKDKISELKKLQKERDTIQQKHNIKGNPMRMKQEIDQLEEKIETIPMGFEQEKNRIIKRTCKCA